MLLSEKQERSIGSEVIVSLHVATGAVAGSLVGSPLRALLLGPVLHLASDRVPHQDIASRRFEIGSGVAAIALLSARLGVLDPATLGAVGASAPDLEHVVPSLRPHGKKLFHGSRGWHRSGAFPVTLQLLLAGALLGFLIAGRRPSSAGACTPRGGGNPVEVP